MKKRVIVYSLTSRGLYSELFNLSLAFLFAKKYNIKFIVNTHFWNARINKGWEDYFEPTLECNNSPLSAQDRVYTKEKPWIGNIYYKPKDFFSFYFQEILNIFYRILHPTHLLTKDIFEEMRSDDFINNTLRSDTFPLMAASFNSIYKLNKDTNKAIGNYVKQLQLPNNYIGVHIRRGDKITSKEMYEIDLNQYTQAIIRHLDTSNNIYIATDDTSTIPLLKKQLDGYGVHIFYNYHNDSQGFNESIYNRSPRSVKYQEVLNVLLDMEILVKSKFFIGTYTSNLSRVVPFFLGLENCESLDNSWNIINSMNKM